MPRFKGDDAEHAFQLYMNNETFGSTLALIMIGFLMVSVYVYIELADNGRYQFERTAMRVAELVLCAVTASWFKYRLRFPPWTYSVGICFMYIGFSFLQNYQTYYIGYVFAYVEAVATWEFGLKALFACFDKHFGRLLIFNACDAVLGAVFVSIPRPVYRVGYDWVWPMITFLWFSVYAYTAEMSVRTTFIRKCELYVARSASEEVSRLHRFVLDATRDVVIVHSVDASARTLYVSRACHNLLGYTQREMLDRSLIELVHPGDLAKARQLLFGMGDSEGVNLAAQGEAGGKYAPPTGGAFDVGPPTTSPSEQNQAVDAFVPCAATNDRVSSFAGWPSPSDVRTVINPVERLPSMNAADTLLAAAAAAAQDSAAAMDALCHPATVHAVELEIPPLEDGGASVSVTSVAGDGVGGNTSAAHTTTLLSVQAHAAPATSNLSTGALPSDAAAVEAWPNVRSAPFARFAAHPATTETGDSSAPPLSPTNGERSSLAPALHGPPHSADSAFMVAPSADGGLGDHSSMLSAVSAPAPRTPVLSATLDTLAQPSAPLPMLSHHASNAPPSVRGDAVAASSGADVAHAAVLSLSARKMSSTASSTTDPNSSVSVQPALALQPESPPSAQRFTALPDARPGASRAAVYAGRSQPRLTGHPHALQHFQGGSLWSPSVITENLRESDDEENDDPRIAARAEETRGLAPAGLMLAAALEAGVNDEQRDLPAPELSAASALSRSKSNAGVHKSLAAGNRGTGFASMAVSYEEGSAWGPLPSAAGVYTREARRMAGDAPSSGTPSHGGRAGRQAVYESWLAGGSAVSAPGGGALKDASAPTDDAEAGGCRRDRVVHSGWLMQGAISMTASFSTSAHGLSLTQQSEARRARLRIACRDGFYILCDVVATRTDQGVVCVYRHAALNHPPTNGVAGGSSSSVATVAAGARAMPSSLHARTPASNNSTDAAPHVSVAVATSHPTPHVHAADVPEVSTLLQRLLGTRAAGPSPTLQDDLVQLQRVLRSVCVATSDATLEAAARASASSHAAAFLRDDAETKKSL